MPKTHRRHADTPPAAEPVYRFDRVPPGHGRRARLPVGRVRLQLLRSAGSMRSGCGR